MYVSDKLFRDETSYHNCVRCDGRYHDICVELLLGTVMTKKLQKLSLGTAQLNTSCNPSSNADTFESSGLTRTSTDTIRE